MKLSGWNKKACIAGLGAVAILAVAPPLKAAEPASPADKTFVGKVSQGGMYEVEASKLAGERASQQKVKNLALTEVEDHEQVNMKLKKLAASHGIDVAAQLNPMFQQRLSQLQSSTDSAFDAAYIQDMQQIHDMDEKLFAQEAMNGSADFKPFAHETDLIVKRHIVALHAPMPK